MKNKNWYLEESTQPTALSSTQLLWMTTQMKNTTILIEFSVQQGSDDWLGS